MSYIFEELKSDKTNRVMSPEKDIRFEEKYTSTLAATGGLYLTETEHNITINRRAVPTLQEPDTEVTEAYRALETEIVNHLISQEQNEQH
jgi:hypothetical protein